MFVTVAQDVHVSVCKAAQLSRCSCRVNWKESKASSMVKAGDVISCAGKGRCVVKAVELTKKERYAVQLVRYV